MIYVYAITEPLARAPRCAGLGDSEVLVWRGSEVAGLYSKHERIEVRIEPQLLWRHQQVVEAAMEAGTTLPVRFGTTFADEDALGSSLEGEGARLARRLDGVRGCVELAVRVGRVESRLHLAPARDGRGYLESKLERLRRQQAIVRDTLRPLGDLAVQAHHAESGSDDEVVRASYLVQRGEISRFTDNVTQLADRNPQLWLSCTGPWPPYSFSALEEPA